MDKIERAAWMSSGWSKYWKPEDGYKAVLVTVTPELAREYIINSVYTVGTNNALVLQYAMEMANGRWDQNGQTMSFSKEGHGVDGNHRSQACVASGVSFVTLVAFGLSQEAVASIDRGRKRSMAQAIGAEAQKKEDRALIDTVTRLIQVNKLPPKACIYPPHLQARFISPSLVQTVRETFFDALDFAMPCIKSHKKGLSNVSISAVVAKAYSHTRKYQGGRERLAAFCDAFASGIIDNKNTDTAVIVLREHLTRVTGGNTHDQGVEVFRKTSYCLEKFMLGEKIDRVGSAEKDPFPLEIYDILTDETYQRMKKVVDSSIKSISAAVNANARLVKELA